MLADEILRGESKNLEFKASLPEKSEKYIRTIVAFANCQGGRLIIGVDDQTREVVGVDPDDVFQTMDAIANAVDDSCAPQIVPDIEPMTIEGKTVIVVTVSPEPNRPYYLRSKGKEKGTYIRLAGTSRPASENKILDLEMEGARVSWDELTCVGFPVKDGAVKKLCRDIAKYRREAELPKKTITQTQLLNWKVLKESEGTILATNAFALLTSDHFSFCRTQCAVFKGTTRSVFLDKREYTGPLYKQIDESVEFVLRNIRLGATIRGLLRHEEYELPVDAIREMIINAHCHRNMLDTSCVQVAIYDDRLEVTSPGGLYGGLTYEQMMNGRSRLRNRAIANVFSQMGLIEAWGTGIGRIREAAEKYGLREPEFIEMDDTFRINLYRKTMDANDAYTELKGEDAGSGKVRESIGKDDVQHRDNTGITSGKVRDNIGITSEKVRENIGKESENHAAQQVTQHVTPQDTQQVTPHDTPHDTPQDTPQDPSKHRYNIGKETDEGREKFGKDSGEVRENIKKTNGEVRERQKEELNLTQRKILELIERDPQITVPQIADFLGITTRGVEKNIRMLRENEFIERCGGRKDGYWRIIPQE